MANNYLKIGSQGDWVSKLQTELNAKGGYGLAVDGKYGPNTEAAIKDYQSKQGLDVDGIVGPETWGMLMHGYDNPFVTTSTPSSPSNGGATNGGASKSPIISTPAPTKPSSTYTSYDDTTEGGAKKTLADEALAYLNSIGDFIWKDQARYDEYVKQWEERPDFSYNFNEDALYQQYHDQFMKQGKMAMQDTMGQASAMTGGYGNSYAQMVGQQAYNAELENLNDVIPELYSMALDKYQMEGQDLLNMIGFLGDERAHEFALYNDDYTKRLTAYELANNDYYNSANMYNTEQDTQNALAQQDWQNAMAIWEANNTNAWNQAQYDESVRQWNEQMAFQKQQYADSQKVSNSGGGYSGGSGGGGNVTVDKNGNLVVQPQNQSTGSKITDSMRDKASTFDSNDDLANWAYGLADSGAISEEDADQLVAQYMDSNEKYAEVEENGKKTQKISYRDMANSTKGWTVVDKGGGNLLGIDKNAKVKSPTGETITLANLKKKLIAEGMKDGEATKVIKKLQQNLGISSNWLFGL